MNIVIIEDERIVADDLEASIEQLLDQPARIVQLHSVKEAIDYLQSSPSIDLIFSDIQLGDGLSFEIFLAVPLAVPIIFCTAYDEYALQAFKANGIDYILKPFTLETLEGAIQKYTQLKKTFSADPGIQYATIMQLLANREPQKTASVLVYHQDKIIPIKVEDIAFFYLENEITHLHTFTGKTHYPNKKLDELESMTDPVFFRANRQFLICRRAIVDVSSFFSRKLSINLTIPFHEKIVVSKAKAPQFLEWLTKSH